MSINRESLVIIFLLTCAMLLWFYLTSFEDSIYTESIDLTQTQQVEQNIRMENNTLYLQLLHLESYTYIASISASKGFTQKQGIVLLK